MILHWCINEIIYVFMCFFLICVGPYLRKAPVISDKPDIVYVVENQSASITITLNHVHAVVAWKRFVLLSLTTRSLGHPVCIVIGICFIN